MKAIYVAEHVQKTIPHAGSVSLAPCILVVLKVRHMFCQRYINAEAQRH